MQNTTPRLRSYPQGRTKLSLPSTGGGEPASRRELPLYKAKVTFSSDTDAHSAPLRVCKPRKILRSRCSLEDEGTSAANASIRCGFHECKYSPRVPRMQVFGAEPRFSPTANAPSTRHPERGQRPRRSFGSGAKRNGQNQALQRAGIYKGVFVTFQR